MGSTSIEDLKREGNELFKKKEWKEAIERYTQAIQKICDNNNKGLDKSNDFMKATLLSNRSLCYLQQFDKERSINGHRSESPGSPGSPDSPDSSAEILEEAIRDTTASLDVIRALVSSNNTASSTKRKDTTSSNGASNTGNDIRSLRAKVLYRRAKANCALSQSLTMRFRNHRNEGTPSSLSSSNLQQLLEQSQQSKMKAVQDLQDLLSFDSKNKLARSLLITIQQQRSSNISSSSQSQSTQGDHQSYLDHLMASSSSTTPVKKSLSIVCQYYFEVMENNQSTQHQHNRSVDGDNNVKVMQSLQYLYSSLVDDLVSTAQELVSYSTTISSRTAIPTTSSTPTTPAKSTSNATTARPTTLQGVQILYNLAFRHYQATQQQQKQHKHNHIEFQSLSMQILNEACMYLPIMHLLDELHSHQTASASAKVQPFQQFTILLLINQLNSNQQTIDKDQCAKYIQLCLSFYIRYILYVHLKEDNTIHESITSCEQKDIPSTSLAVEKSQFLIPIIIQIYSSLLKTPTKSTHLLFSSIQSLLHAIITVDPQSVLNQIKNSSSSEMESISTSKKQQSRLLHNYPIKALSTQEVHILKPRDLALYRKKQYMVKQNQKYRCRNHAILFCKSKGLDILLRHAIFANSASIDNEGEEGRQLTSSTNDSYLRREIMITISKVIQCFSQSNDNLMQKGTKQGTTTESDAGSKIENDYILNDNDLKKIVIDKFFPVSEQESTSHTLTIEEIDDEENNDHFLRDIERILGKSLLSASMLLANGELGTWILRKAWPDSKNEWKTLVDNHMDDKDVKNHICMSIASELASAAASVESARSWIISCAGNNDDNTYWKKLLSSENQDVRSGAASAMAKLGLSDKTISSDEGELFALLEVAGGLIVGARDDTTVPNESYSNSITQVERGMELLSYLCSKTLIKDEIAHGFTISHSFEAEGSSKSDKSLLEHLVDLSSVECLSGNKSDITSSISYALSTIFSSLAVSVETLRREAFADKEITVEQYDQLQAMGKTNEEKELEESKIDQDSSGAVKSRIQNMTSKGVCTAIVNLIKEGVSERTKEQLVICMMRMATEPTIRGKMIQNGCLSECQKIARKAKSNEVIPTTGKKIIQLAQHTIGKLLVTTNPALLSTSQRMGSVQPLIQLIKDNDASDLQRFEALLSITNLAGFDDETKNRIVAERGISVLSYAMFSDHEMVRRSATEAMSNLVPHSDVIVYLRQPDRLKVFVAFASDFESNYECARAASGCLAMITGDVEIARQFCKLSNSRAMVEVILSSGKLELMHRILVILLNLTENEREWVVASGSLTFCEAYIEKYHNQMLESLGFSDVDMELMKTTIQLSQEIVKGSSKVSA